MSPSPSPSLRADAVRNRESLLAVATHAFATADDEPSMRAIAREAGVGVATLYRHFPTREELVDAVYRDQVHRLTSGATELLATYPPREAMRRWMDLFADWVATKRGMLGTLQAMIDTGAIPHAQTRVELCAAVEDLLAAGRRAGELRVEVGADDVLAQLIGISMVAGAPSQREQAGRLMDLLASGLHAPG